MKLLQKLMFVPALLLLATISAKCQNEEANQQYLAAEQQFSNNDFIKTVALIEAAETTSASTSSKWLYLKIKALNELYLSSAANGQKMKLALEKFQTITDQATFPEEKYQEIQSIGEAFKQYMTNDRNSFLVAKSKMAYDAIRGHMTKFPGTFYKQQLDSVSTVLQSRDMIEQRKANEIKFNELTKQASALRGKAAGKSVSGTVWLLVSLGGLGYCGLEAYNNYSKMSDIDEITSPTDEQLEMRDKYFTKSIIYGSAALLSGCIGLPVAFGKYKKAKNFRKEANNLTQKAEGYKVTLSPYVNPSVMALGFTAKIKL